MGLVHICLKLAFEKRKVRMEGDSSLSQCHTFAKIVQRIKVMYGHAYPTSHVGHAYPTSHVGHAYPTSHVGLSLIHI